MDNTNPNTEATTESPRMAQLEARTDDLDLLIEDEHIAIEMGDANASSDRLSQLQAELFEIQQELAALQAALTKTADRVSSAAEIVEASVTVNVSDATTTSPSNEEVAAYITERFGRAPKTPTEWSAARAIMADPENNEPCCGDGLWKAGPFVNGVPAKTGKHFRCAGKGYTTPEDRRRNEYYDNNIGGRWADFDGGYVA